MTTSDETSNSGYKKPQGNFVPGIRGRNGKSPSLFILATAVLIIASFYWAQAVLIPIAISILLTFLLTPVADSLERLGLGRVFSVILIVILVFSFLFALGWVVTVQLTSVANELPTYRKNIEKKIADIRGAGKGGVIEKVQETAEEVKKELEKKDEAAKIQPKPREVVVQGEQASTFWPLPLDIAPMFERLASAGLAIVLVIFMLIQREDLRNRLIHLVGYGRLTTTTRALEEASQRISRYLLMQSIINASFGIAVGIALYLIGLPYALLWGFLAAMLRFIPYVGPWVAAIMPGALSLIVFEGWMWPALVVAVFLVLELINNMILEPLLYGESAGVSEVGLLVAVAFWTWLWGPVGLLLATPLTVCVVVLSKYVPQLDFISVLMSDEPVMQSNVSYYQRLLARDQDEAEEILEAYLKSHPPERVYDDVLIPALNDVKKDFDFGKLDEGNQHFIFKATREILEDLNGLNPDASSSPAAMIKKASPPTTARVRILGLPVRDEADELALLMCRQLLTPSRYEMEVLPDEALTSEVVDQVAEKCPALLCIVSLPPGGLAQTRYLCKRLRSRFPDTKILVGRLGTQAGDHGDALLGAGADKVATTLIELRDQIIQVSQIIAR
ncbi:MAG TPA: AI-2E family transporter [Candidatus Binatia bacterium]|nr:AI-2E family transporter [Candidatus Binatia bacterium]